METLQATTIAGTDTVLDVETVQDFPDPVRGLRSATEHTTQRRTS